MIISSCWNGGGRWQRCSNDETEGFGKKKQSAYEEQDAGECVVCERGRERERKRGRKREGGGFTNYYALLNLYYYAFKEKERYFRGSWRFMELYLKFKNF